MHIHNTWCGVCLCAEVTGAHVNEDDDDDDDDGNASGAGKGSAKARGRMLAAKPDQAALRHQRGVSGWAQHGGSRGDSDLHPLPSV